MDPGLPLAIKEARALGFKIGLHTTGAYPKRLEEILEDLHWVGFDFKAPWHRYHEVIEREQPPEMIQQSLQQLLESNCPYEIRTTIHSALHQPEDLIAMAQYLAEQGVTHWVLQNFRAEGCINNTLAHLHPHDQSLLGAELLARIKRLVPEVSIR